MNRLLGITFIGAVVAMPAWAAKPQIQWDPNYDFSQIRTFSWRDTAGQSLAQSNPFLHQHIINALEYQLSATGLREVESNADVEVTYYGSTETNYTLESESYGYGFGAYGRGGWGAYGYGMGGPVSTTTSVHSYERGTLVVDIVDADNDELIWRGTVGDITVSDSVEKQQKAIDKAIKKLAKQSAKLREGE
jgi:hypothetical protein